MRNIAIPIPRGAKSPNPACALVPWHWLRLACLAPAAAALASSDTVVVPMWRRCRRLRPVASAGLLMASYRASAVQPALSEPLSPSSASPAALPASRAASSAEASAEEAPSGLRIGVTMREVREGSGEQAASGMLATVHYTVRLVGDGTLLEDTRNSGYGERDYGAPLSFRLGELSDRRILRALHLCALDMRVGGVRRVRTCLLDSDFGYTRTPEIPTARSYRVKRELGADWLIDLELELVALQPPPGPTLLERLFGK